MQCSSLFVVLLTLSVAGIQARKEPFAKSKTVAYTEGDGKAGGDGVAEADDKAAYSDQITYSFTGKGGFGVAKTESESGNEDADTYNYGYTETTGPAYAGTVGAGYADPEVTAVGTYTEGASEKYGTTYTDSYAYASGKQGTADSWSFIDTAGPAYAGAGGVGYATEEETYGASAAGGGSEKGGYSNSYGDAIVDGKAGYVDTGSATYTEGDADAYAEGEGYATKKKAAASAGAVATSGDGGYSEASASTKAESGGK